jgi:hypothetical protein
MVSVGGCGWWLVQTSSQASRKNSFYFAIATYIAKVEHGLEMARLHFAASVADVHLGPDLWLL